MNAFGETQLAGGERLLGARAIGRRDEAQPVAVRVEHDLEALPPRHVGVEAAALAAALAFLHAAPAPAQRRPEHRAVEHGRELARGEQGEVLVDLEDLEPVDQHALVELGGLELAVGGERTAQHRLDRIAHPQRAGAGADQQQAGARPPRPAGGLRVLGRAQVGSLDHLQRVLEQRVAHAGLEQPRRELADLAEADDERTHRLAVASSLKKTA